MAQANSVQRTLVLTEKGRRYIAHTIAEAQAPRYKLSPKARKYLKLLRAKNGINGESAK
jgi:hypothetical protein